MTRTRPFRVAAAAALLCVGPPAAASLRATGIANAGAHLVSDDGDTLQTPGPGSLTITAGAAASDSVPHVPPPPEFFAIESLVTGIGTARYGSLAGHCLTEASSKPAWPLPGPGQPRR